MNFKKGQAVRLIAPVIAGTIAKRRVIDADGDGVEGGSSDEILCLVQWQDAEGNAHERWFKEAELEAV